MKNPLQAFAFDSHAVRVVTINDAPWFVAKDVAQCLGLTHHRDATRKLDDDEKDGVEITDAIGRLQQTTVISESGLYTMVLRCDGATTPGTSAHTFRKWITSEVLPSIRKTGSYSAPNAAPMGELAQVLVRVDRLIGVVEKLIETLPAILAMQRPKVRRPAIYEKDLPAIFALRKQGETLTDIARATGFGQTSLYYVLEGKYTLSECGRVKRVAGTNDKVSAIVAAGAA
jgi:prophage antirepressor-like protein